VPAHLGDNLKKWITLATRLRYAAADATACGCAFRGWRVLHREYRRCRRLVTNQRQLRNLNEALGPALNALSFRWPALDLTHGPRHPRNRIGRRFMVTRRRRR
jgi:hypothetical protein